MKTLKELIDSREYERSRDLKRIIDHGFDEEPIQESRKSPMSAIERTKSNIENLIEMIFSHDIDQFHYEVLAYAQIAVAAELKILEAQRMHALKTTFNRRAA